jgi:hypothetical protein
MAWVAGAAVVFAAIYWADRENKLWWVSQSLEASVVFYPGFAWAAGIGVIVSLVALAADRRAWRLRSFWMLSPVALPILLLAFGVVFQHSRSEPGPAPEWPKHVVEWFPWLLAPLGLVLLGCFRSVSNWAIIVGISTVALWLLFGSQLMSWMSVTDIWL